MEGKLTYESAMEELEKIVKKLEDGKLPLDTSLALFERGTNLANFCNESLTSAEKRIERLTKAEEDNVAENGLEDYDEL